jgi:hypothetical protein
MAMQALRCAMPKIFRCPQLPRVEAAAVRSNLSRHGAEQPLLGLPR